MMARYGDVQSYYAAYDEAGRLDSGVFQLERERTREILSRHLPPAPAIILDVGGGPGEHARWLTRGGYEVHLVDVVPRHVEQALAGDPVPASARIGDARRLEREDASCDVVLLLGPLYHLQERDDRLAALREARRVLRPGGLLAAASISRFASLLDHLVSGSADAAFAAVISDDLESGRHRNETGRLELFTEAFFHRPEDLQEEIGEAGFTGIDLVAVEGPGALAPDFASRWREPRRREELLGWVRATEREPSILGVSMHLLALARA